MPIHEEAYRPACDCRRGLHHRLLAIERDGEIVWVWIGSHAEYDLLLRRKG